GAGAKGRTGAGSEGGHEGAGAKGRTGAGSSSGREDTGREGRTGAVQARAALGKLFLNSDPWARIYIDGHDSGITTPTVQGIELPAGPHRLRLVNPTLELAAEIEIDLAPGEELKRFVDLRARGVQR
ncbi:MAG: PEGA domain-containing protein, partial [Deltaproteobacteria bacterium]|nr:PEGA domain-containing protein [Deltaproteobacteria bacterium]